MQVQAVNHIKAYTRQASRGDHIQKQQGFAEGMQGKVTRRSIDLRLGKLGIEFRSQQLETENLQPRKQQVQPRSTTEFGTELELAFDQMQNFNNLSGQKQTSFSTGTDSHIQRLQAFKAYARQQDSQTFPPGFSMLRVQV